MEGARRSARSARYLARLTRIAVRSTRALSARPAATPRPSAFPDRPQAVAAHRCGTRTRPALVGVLLAASLGGPSCAISTVDSPGYARGANQGVNTGFTPTTSFNLPPRSQNCPLDLLAVGQTPSRAIVPIGPVTTHTEGAGEDRDMAVIRLKERACMSGAHGLMQISAETRADWCDGTYTLVAEGWAMAFVYVDAFGRPLADPGASPVAIAPPAAPGTPLPPESGGK
jgi:hypothetical protein